MKWPLFRSARRETTIEALYGAIVAQARSASFYRDYGVADTVDGRFDMIVLHAALFLDRVADEPEEIKALGQGIFDRFCRDMDANLREMGVSDLGVPREMRRMGEAFYGRSVAYRAALREDDNAALVEALKRNVYAGQPTAAPDPLAAYVRRAVGRLRTQDASALAAGHLHWPDLDPISAVGGEAAASTAART